MIRLFSGLIPYSCSIENRGVDIRTCAADTIDAGYGDYISVKGFCFFFLNKFEVIQSKISSPF